MNGVVEAEVAVLGSCLADQESLRKAVGVLVPENFGDPRNAAIFRRMLEEIASGRPVDVITLGEKLSPELGGSKYLFEVTNLVPSALHVTHYADIVRRAWAERRLVDSCRRVAAEPNNEAFRESLRLAFTDGAMAKRHITTIGGSMSEYLEALDKRIVGQGDVFPTRLPTLDRFLTGGGFLPGQLVMIGARTSRGKSSFLLKNALTFAKQGRKVLFLSAEMTLVELTDRLIAMESGIPLSRLASRGVKEFLLRVTAVAGQIQRLPIEFSIGGRFTLERVTADMETSQASVVIVDYVQRFSPPEGKEGSRAAFFSDVANGLKSLALTKGVLIMTASQLGRAVEFRDDRTPTLADLKESGGLEEAPDIVMFLHFPSDPDSDNRRQGEFILAKQRNGPVGKIPAIFIGDTTVFQERENEEPHPFG